MSGIQRKGHVHKLGGAKQHHEEILRVVETDNMVGSLWGLT